MGIALPGVTSAAGATPPGQQPTGGPGQQPTSGPQQQPAGEVAEMVPIEHEGSERMVRVMIFAVPPALLALAGWLAWGGTLHWQDLLVLAITYTLTGLGITVGYHRLFTH